MGSMYDKKNRTFVNDLTVGGAVGEVFLVKEAAVKTTRKGSAYLDAVLSDRTGTIACKLWDVPDNILDIAQPGAYLRVKARVEEYGGRLQLVLAAVPAQVTDVDPADFEETSPVPLEELENDVKSLSGLLSDKGYAALVKAVLDDEEIWSRFRVWPAAAQYHHAYRHGLLEHTVSVCRLAVDVAEKTRRVNSDLLLAGAFLHDIGKVFELTGKPPYDYTDEGRLLGHLFLGARLVEEKAGGIKSVSEEKIRLVVHLILAHHGEREYGSPVLPALPEALALHHIDNIDAKIRAASYAIEQDTNPNTSWTDYLRMLETRIYKGGPGPVS